MVHVHVVITDSGLGGLSICAELERTLRTAAWPGTTRLTYVNAWPEQGRGYNDFPDAASRAAVFDRALGRMIALGPDRIVIACNTLSILYYQTACASRPPVPIQGIVGAGVALFMEELAHDVSASIVLLGTKTTIESGAHRDELVRLGVEPGRIAGVSCHGLATAIERDVDGPGVGELIARCASDVLAAEPTGASLLLGLCCTHYGYVARRLEESVGAVVSRPVRALDPNRRLVQDLGWTGGAAGPGNVSVEVLSKVALDERTVAGIARLVGPVSPVTARALACYSHVPDLF